MDSVWEELIDHFQWLFCQDLSSFRSLGNIGCKVWFWKDSVLWELLELFEKKWYEVLQSLVGFSSHALDLSYLRRGFISMIEFNCSVWVPRFSFYSWFPHFKISSLWLLKYLFLSYSLLYSYPSRPTPLAYISVSSLQHLSVPPLFLDSSCIVYAAHILLDVWFSIASWSTYLGTYP